MPQCQFLPVRIMINKISNVIQTNITPGFSYHCGCFQQDSQQGSHTNLNQLVERTSKRTTCLIPLAVDVLGGLSGCQAELRVSLSHSCSQALKRPQNPKCKRRHQVRPMITSACQSSL